VGALSLYIEDEGVPTVQLSLVREHTAAIRPPRALWVPFMLGRPLGAPGDAQFQRRVLAAALRLFERDAGPVLEDFPEDAPADASGVEAEPLACPVSFATTTAAASLGSSTAEEVAQLQVWHDVAVRKRGRSTVGLVAASMDDIVRYVGAWADGGTPDAPVPDLSPHDALRLACEDIKAFYLEAALAQPGRRTPAELHDWFWTQTAAGRLIIALQATLAKSSDRALRALAAGSLLPRHVQEAVKQGQNNEGRASP
jgi:hypothetical protein